MGFLSWLKGLGDLGEGLEEGALVPLLTEDQEERGALLVHKAKTRDYLISQFSQYRTDNTSVHNGFISSFLFDQLSASSGMIAATIQAGKMVQVVASPAISSGLRSGSMAIMQSGGLMTGNVVASGTGKIVGQFKFAPMGALPVVAPLVAWQILNAVAGVQQLARINARLDCLQRGLERLVYRQQAKTMGQLAAAIATLEDISDQFRVCRSFTPDMVIRLALADRDIQACLAEQQFIINRFDELVSKITESSKGKKGAVSANTLLKEEAGEFMVDAHILTAAAKASLLSNQAWLRHDLEHNSPNVPRRLKDLETELRTTSEMISPLTKLNELDEFARACVNEMNWFNKHIFASGLKNEIKKREILTPNQGQQESEPLPSVLIWKGENNKINTVMIDSQLEN